MTHSDPIARFDGTTISYTYDNGWDFSNTFEGDVRAWRGDNTHAYAMASCARQGTRNTIKPT